MILNGRHGDPVFDLVAFGTDKLRRTSRSHSTVEQGLRGVALLLDYALANGFTLEDRVDAGTFLSQAEARDLISELEHPRGGRKPGPGTVRRRVDAAMRYFRWLASSRNAEFVLSGRLDQALATLKDIRPRRAGADGKRVGLTEDQKKVLLEALRAAAAAAAPGSKAAFVAARLILYFEWSFELGLRVGENMGLRLRDIDFGLGEVRIVRRPDAADDHRRNPARVKGEGRPLPISRHLAKVTRRFVSKLRARCPHSVEHDFLFVSWDGRPLSIAMIAKSFRKLRKDHPELGAKFTSHVMRHSWNDWFSEHAAGTGMTAADEAETRRVSQGWADEKSARSYVSGHTRRLQRQASLARQAGMFGEVAP